MVGEEKAVVQPETLTVEVLRHPGGRPPKPKPQKSAKPSEPRKGMVKRPDQIMFEAVCRALGWDYRLLPTTKNNSQRGEVNQLVGIFMENSYTPEDVDNALEYWQQRDWRWLQNQSYPTGGQLRLKVGQVIEIRRNIEAQKGVVIR